MKQTTSAIIASVIAATASAVNLEAQGFGWDTFKNGFNGLGDLVEDGANLTSDYFRKDFLDDMEGIGNSTLDFSKTATKNALVGVMKGFYAVPIPNGAGGSGGTSEPPAPPTPDHYSYTDKFNDYLIEEDMPVKAVYE